MLSLPGGRVSLVNRAHSEAEKPMIVYDVPSIFRMGLTKGGEAIQLLLDGWRILFWS